MGEGENRSNNLICEAISSVIIMLKATLKQHRVRKKIIHLANMFQGNQILNLSQGGGM